MNCDKKDLLLYAVTDRAWLGDKTLSWQVEESLKGGATMIQLREKHLDHEHFLKEAKEIKEVFGNHAFELNISSTKSMTGHLLGAAGAVESIASILAIKNGIVPPTINHEEGDDDENIDYNLNFTFNKAQKREVNVALSNTFGFGGHNACVIFKKYAE